MWSINIPQQIVNGDMESNLAANGQTSALFASNENSSEASHVPVPAAGRESEINSLSQFIYH